MPPSHDDQPCPPDEAARIRDYLFQRGAALPHEVAEACRVPIGVVLRLVREGTLKEIREPEQTTCEVCDVPGVVGSLCGSCRTRLTPPPEDEPPLPRRAPREPVPPKSRGKHRFHSRRR